MKDKPMKLPPDEPFTGPSDWYSYRCRSCDHTDWIEEIVIDAFPPVEPEGVPALFCPECGGNFRCDTSKPIKQLQQHPDHTS